MAVLINFSGFKSELQLDEPRPTKRPNWPLDMSLLEMYLHRLKGLSRFAVKLFGKNFEKQREPILVFVQTNETQIDAVDQFLLKFEYFGYQGIICFATEVGPVLNDHGKITINNKNQANLCSTGSGAFLKSLNRDGLLKMLK